jgi:hypothetical protein
VIPGGPRPIPPTGDARESVEERQRGDGDGDEPTEAAEAAADGSGNGTTDTPPTEAAQRPTAVPIGDDEEILDLSDEERAAVPTRSDEPG